MYDFSPHIQELIDGSPFIYFPTDDKCLAICQAVKSVMVDNGFKLDPTGGILTTIQQAAVFWDFTTNCKSLSWKPKPPRELSHILLHEAAHGLVQYGTSIGPDIDMNDFDYWEMEIEAETVSYLLACKYEATTNSNLDFIQNDLYSDNSYTYYVKLNFAELVKPDRVDGNHRYIDFNTYYNNWNLYWNSQSSRLVNMAQALDEKLEPTICALSRGIL